GREADWRAAGAAVARAGARERTLTVALPAGVAPAAVRGLVEGLQLAAYRFRLGADRPDGPRLRRVRVAVADPDRFDQTVTQATVVARSTYLARDLTNTPSLRKTPAWFARQVAARADIPGLTVRVWGESDLAEAGFGGILAVGGGSANPPRLLELSWRPRGAREHVVLVGKGITFDTGGGQDPHAQGRGRGRGGGRRHPGSGRARPAGAADHPHPAGGEHAQRVGVASGRRGAPLGWAYLRGPQHRRGGAAGAGRRAGV